jgi:hypothetical protein
VTWLSRIGRFLGFDRPTQTCWVYCPRCRAELTSDESPVHEDEHGLVHYDCVTCHAHTVWDFDHPAPLFLYAEPTKP